MLLLLFSLISTTAAALSLQTTVQQRSGRALLIDAAPDQQKVWMWGQNSDGLIDPAQPGVVATPTVPPAYTAISARATGSMLGGCAWQRGVCLWYTSGEMWCWGSADVHGVPPDAFGVYAAPYRLNNSDVVSVTGAACGDVHVCVTLDAPYTDAVWCHGDNSMQQLGGGNGTDREWMHRFGVSETVVPFSGDINGGGNSTCVQLVPSHAQHCWGDNRRGQLGRNQAAPALPIVDGLSTAGGGAVALPLDTVLATAGGVAHWCDLYGGGATASWDGAVRCWGDNTWNQLGALSPSFAPVIGTAVIPLATSAFQSPMVNSVKVHRVYAGGYMTCLTWPRDTPVNVSCFGRDTYGEAGHADPRRTQDSNYISSVTYSTIPTIGGSGGGGVPVRGMALGNATTLVLVERQTGLLTLLGYGLNEHGLLGVGDVNQSLVLASSDMARSVDAVAPSVTPTLVPATTPLPTTTAPPQNQSVFVPTDVAPSAWDATGDIAVSFDALGRRPDYRMQLLVDQQDTCFSRDQFVVYFSHIEQVVADARAPGGWRSLFREAYPWGGYAVRRETYTVMSSSPSPSEPLNVTRVYFSHRFPQSGAAIEHINVLMATPAGENATAEFDLFGDGHYLTAVRSGQHKLAVRISEWTSWLLPDARLRVVFGIQSMNGTDSQRVVGAPLANSSASSSSSSFEHDIADGGGGVRLVSSFESTAVPDGVLTAVAAVDVQLLDDGNIGVVMPPFAREVFYDPNFAVLTSASAPKTLDYRCTNGRLVAYDNGGGGGFSGSTLLIVIVVCVVGAVVATVAVVLVTNRRRFFGHQMSELGQSRLQASKLKLAERFNSKEN